MICFFFCSVFSFVHTNEGVAYAAELKYENSTKKPKIKALKKGSVSPYVKNIQKLLALNGYYFDAIDGDFGSNTEEAVRNFQRDQGLKITGIVDSKTLKKMQAINVVPKNVKKKLKVNASAYSSADPGCSEYTYSGTKLKKGIVAVDPKVIPLGTKLYIPGYGYAVAEDIGGAIKGNKIDLAFGSQKEAIQFGRRDIVIQILD